MSVQISIVMRTKILTLSPATPIREAAGMLHAGGQESAPVVDESGALVGILTQKDCFRPAVQASYYQQWRGSVGEHMRSPVRTIDADADIVTAAEMFIAESYRSLPVLDSGKLVGVLHRADVLGALLQRS